MNLKEFNIITDFTDGEIPLEESTIAVTNNLTCGVCNDDTAFSPLICNGIKWHCEPCWNTEYPDALLSEGTKLRLEEIVHTTKCNYHIRLM